jgi:hypothetical protein
MRELGDVGDSGESFGSKHAPGFSSNLQTTSMKPNCPCFIKPH